MTEEFRGTDGVYRMLFEPEEFAYIEDYLDRSLEQTARAQPRCEADAEAAVRVIETFYSRLLLNPIADARQSFGTVPEQYVNGAWAPSSLVPGWLEAVETFNELIETDCFGLAPMPDFDDVPLEDDPEPTYFPWIGVMMRRADFVTPSTPVEETDEDLAPGADPWDDKSTDDSGIDTGDFGIQGEISPSSSQGLVIASVALTAAVGIGWLLLRK